MKKIDIYSTATCHFCHMAKEYLTANNVPFNDYNVGIDTARRSEMVEKSGQMGVPVIIVDDKDVIVGFDKERLASLVGLPA